MNISALVSAAALWMSVLGLIVTRDTMATETYSFEQLAPGVHVHFGRHEAVSLKNAGDIANSAFVIGSNGVAVIDPGGSVQNGRRLLAAVAQATELPIRWVVLTHIHPDHWAAVSVFSDEVEVIAHHNYPRALIQRGDFYRDRFPTLFDANREKALRLPDTLVKDEIQLDIGTRLLRLTAHPTAHTDNDLSVLDLATHTLFAGDLVFSRRLPSLDGSLTGWLRVLETLSQQPFERVVPGHGRPGSWSRVAGPQLRYLRMLRRNIRERLASGDTLSEVLDKGLPTIDSAAWELFDTVQPANLTKAYTELEWE